MRWVFFCLLILNVVYLVWGLVIKAAPAPMQVVDTPVQTGGAQLVLLSEAGVSGSYQVLNTDGKHSLCSAVGPWTDRIAAEQVLAELGKKGYRGLSRAVQVDKDRLHWVFLPPHAERDQAMRTLRELQTRGVDSFIVADGADANAISLGYFSSPESARGLMVKMKTAGYPAQTRETVRQETEYWLYFNEQGVPDEGQALRQFLADNPAKSGENAQCNSGQVNAVPRGEVEPETLPAG